METVSYSAAVLIWNYTDRLGLDPFNKFNAVLQNSEQTVDQIMISTHSLISIQTEKTKSRAGGRFTITLAPTKNWLGSIAVGSWCAILMTRQPLTQNDLSGSQSSADPKKFKFLGRIETVQATSDVNTQNGARRILYTVTGVDWSDIFNNVLYVDPFMTATDNRSGGIGSQLPVLAKIYSQMLNKHLDSVESAQYSQSLTVKAAIESIMLIWREGIGEYIAAEQEMNKEGVAIKINSLMSPTIPREVLRYMGLAGTTDEDGNLLYGDMDFLRVVARIHGSLERRGNVAGTHINDSYNQNVYTGGGYLKWEDLSGSHSAWSLLLQHGNTVLNELIADLRFDPQRKKLIPTVYNRVRPFIINADSNRTYRDSHRVGDGLISQKKSKRKDNEANNQQKSGQLISRFQDVRRLLIPSNEVISCNVATSWKDSSNFIEIIPAFDASGVTLPINFKAESQFYNLASMKRDGFRSKMEYSHHFPQEAGTGNPNLGAIAEWKYVLKEWYFDLHRMLKGSITIMGQDQYIQVGDNIMVPGDVVSYIPNHTKGQLESQAATYLLAHIESINHSFTVNDNGTKSFRTTIQFVRGIFTDINGNPVRPKLPTSYVEEGKLDQDASQVTEEQEYNPNIRISGE